MHFAWTDNCVTGVVVIAHTSPCMLLVVSHTFALLVISNILVSMDAFLIKKMGSSRMMPLSCKDLCFDSNVAQKNLIVTLYGTMPISTHEFEPMYFCWRCLVLAFSSGQYFDLSTSLIKMTVDESSLVRTVCVCNLANFNMLKLTSVPISIICFPRMFP